MKTGRTGCVATQGMRRCAPRGLKASLHLGKRSGLTMEGATPATPPNRPASADMANVPTDSEFAAPETDRIRLTLALAFTRYLERTEWADCGHVTLRWDGMPPEVSYRYRANGSGRGGAHYLRGLGGREVASIRDLATAVGLTVLAEGASFVSVSFVRPRVLQDVRFLERILAEVFGRSIEEVTTLVEIVDRESRRDWVLEA